MNKQKFLPFQMKGLWPLSLIQIIQGFGKKKKKKKELNTYYVQDPVPDVKTKVNFPRLENLS